MPVLRLVLRLASVCVAAAFLAACTGEPDPTGTPGPAGPTGTATEFNVADLTSTEYHIDTAFITGKKVPLIASRRMSLSVKADIRATLFCLSFS